MAVQTQRALARRAIEAAQFMRGLSDFLQKEATDQKVEWFSDAALTLSARTLGHLVYKMRELTAGIQGLEDNLTREKIKGRGHL